MSVDVVIVQLPDITFALRVYDILLGCACQVLTLKTPITY